MKRLILLLLAACLLLPASSMAEIYKIAGPSELPEGWAEKDLLRLIVVDTDRSDAMILQCGGETMLVDGGVWSHYQRVFAKLDEYGVKEIKYLYNTHSDGDHVEGLISILNGGNYKVGAYLSANPTNFQDKRGYHQMAVGAAKKANVPYQQIFDGDILKLGAGGGVRFFDRSPLR